MRLVRSNLFIWVTLAAIAGCGTDDVPSGAPASGGTAGSGATGGGNTGGGNTGGTGGVYDSGLGDGSREAGLHDVGTSGAEIGCRREAGAL